MGIILITVSLGGIFTFCKPSVKEDHFITDPEYRNLVEQEFDVVKTMSKGRQNKLFDVFKQNLTLEETEALKFLYAFMPLSDIANGNGDFYLRNVKLAFEARELFPWGKDVPEDVFRHFVLPYRINNEDVDSSRSVFLKELYPRVKEMDIEHAALEVNHWCHEKVNYQPTNIRTMAPLGVIKTAYGRCGEESTFATTALRAVGIPARQVYTPRWAHSDDNHAWVEVFIDGKWKYLGACEPAPELNTAWFDEPVQRAMMVHTKTFGKYKGNEVVLEEHGKYSILNLLSNYVSVKSLTAKVTDDSGIPLKDVTIEFGLYNYAEYFTLKKSVTDESGSASILTGYGDIRIMAFDSTGNFEVVKTTVENTDTAIIKLTKEIGQDYSFSWDNIPPAKKVVTKIKSEKSEENAARLVYEDSLRNSFVNTFYTEHKAMVLANNLNLDLDRLTSIMIESRGNYKNIEDFVINGGVGYDRKLIIDLLEVIESKDLHDISSEVLIDHLKNFNIYSENIPDDIVNKFILNPRMLNERIMIYRRYLYKTFEYLLKRDVKEIVAGIISWTNANIAINNQLNYYGTALSPVGLYELKVADENSRNIFVIAVLRSLGIPARIEETLFVPQYFDNGWIDISFNETNMQRSSRSPRAFISFDKSDNLKIDPLYRVHFGLSKLDGNEFVTLEFGWDKKLSDFDDTLEVSPGYYQLITGNRIQNGTVLVDESFFEIKEGEYNKLNLEIRNNSKPLEILGSWNQNEVINDYVIYCWIDPGSEPGKHFINDFKLVKETYIDRDIPITFYCRDIPTSNELNKSLSENFTVIVDDNFNGINSNQFIKDIDPDLDLPIVVLINNRGEVLFFASGYNIGTPDQLLKLIDRIN